MVFLFELVLAACLQQPAKDPVADQIEEFKRYYKPTRTTHEKVEAIHVLEKLDDPSAAELLLEACGDAEFPVRAAALQVLAGYRGEPVRELLRRTAGDEKGTRHGRRSGAIQSLGNLADAGAVPILVRNLEHKDFEVRRASIVALGQIKDPTSVEPLVKVLEAEEPALRTAALDALGALRQPAACVPAMLPLLQAEQWQVRAAAIQALGRMRVKETVQPLIDALRHEEGRLREDVLVALKLTTSFDFDVDADRWQNWWNTVQATFQIPTDAELAKRKEAQEKSNKAYARPGTTEFAGVPSRSTRLIFVIDTSGSMEDLIGDTRNFKLKDRGYKSFMKMDIVKDELVRTIDALGPDVRFNIITFATEVKAWKEMLVQANVVNKAAATKFIQELKPIGGASQGFKAKSGLSGSAGLSAGKTNTYAALMAGLDGGTVGASGTPRAAVTGNSFDKRYDSPVDTIYFLSDGVPSHGEYVEKEEILAEVRRVNTLRKMVLHTISIGDMDHALMEQLAQQNGGVFVDLGK